MPKAVKVLQDKKFKMKEQMVDTKKTLVAFKNTIDQGKATNKYLAEKLDSANKPKTWLWLRRRVSHLLSLSCKIQILNHGIVLQNTKKC